MLIILILIIILIVIKKRIDILTIDKLFERRHYKR